MVENYQIPNYRQIPKPRSQQEIFKVVVKNLLPTQICVGLTEVWNRQKEFSKETKRQRLHYLHKKPIPIVRNKNNQLWMLDRHHRLRALLELDKEVEAYGYLVAEVDTVHTSETLEFLSKQGWLYLFDHRDRGPLSPQLLPESLLKMKDDPYRSLAWRLKQEGVISPAPLIPYHEFHWGKWLRKRSLPPFNSKNLSPALLIAQKLAYSQAASHLAGWKGRTI